MADDAGELSEIEMILRAYAEPVTSAGKDSLRDAARALSDLFADRLAAFVESGQLWEVVSATIAKADAQTAAAEQEADALREQVAAVADVLSSPRWLGTKSKQARRLKRAIRAALADPASVLAQRDAEVGAKALEDWASELPPWSPPYASLREQGAADGWRHAQDVARERARGLRQGVDRG